MTSDRSPVGVRHLTVVPENYDGDVDTDADEHADRAAPRDDRATRRGDAD